MGKQHVAAMHILAERHGGDWEVNHRHHRGLLVAESIQEFC